MKKIETEFVLNDLTLNDKKITVIKKVTLLDTDTRVRYVIRASKGGAGMKLVYKDPQEVLNKFSELIKG